VTKNATKQIEYWHLDLADMKTAYFDSGAAEGVVYNLKPNRRNYAQIRVFNNAGQGPASTIVVIDMPEGGCMILV